MAITILNHPKKKFDKFPLLPWSFKIRLTILPCSHDCFWQFYTMAMASELFLASFGPYTLDIFPEKNQLRFFDKFPPWLWTKVDNFTLWPWNCKFSNKKVDNCTLWIFDNCTPRIFDNFPRGVIWQFSVSPVGGPENRFMEIPANL
jgi:hypothetical protein